MSPKKSGGSSKFPGGLKVIHSIGQTTNVRAVTPVKSGLKTGVTALFYSHNMDGYYSNHRTREVSNGRNSCRKEGLTLGVKESDI